MFERECQKRAGGKRKLIPWACACRMTSRIAASFCGEESTPGSHFQICIWVPPSMSTPANSSLLTMVRPCACIHTRIIDVHAVDTRLYACVRGRRN